MEIPIVSWTDNIIKRCFENVFAQVNQGTDEFLKSRDILKRGQKLYSEFVKDRFGHIQILGMSRPLPLDRIYVKLRVNHQIQSKQFVNTDSLMSGGRGFVKHRQRQREQTSDDPVALLSTNNRVALLGKPGAGKTTFFKYLALLYTGNSSHSLAVTTRAFPILVILRDFVRQKSSLFEHLCTVVRDCGFPYADLFVTRLLKEGDGLILIDGLDELSDQAVEDVYQQIHCLVKSYPKNHFVVSCRTASYGMMLENFTEVEIEDFRPRQKYEFITEWFASDRAKGEALKTLIRQRKELAELAESPLLLSLICVLYGRDLQLPKSRVELYERCVRTMLVEWDSSRNFRRETKYEQLSDYRKVKLLNFFAANMFCLGMSAFNWRETEEVIAKYLPGISLSSEEARGVLNEIKTHNGIITKTSATTYSFSHLTLQEFLTASYLVDARKEHLALDWVGDPRWIEIFAHIASLLEDASSFLERLLGRRDGDRFYKLCLASYCACGESRIAPPVRERILSELANELTAHIKVVGKIYVPHGADTHGALFVEAKDTDKNGIKEFGLFLTSLNCLISVLTPIEITRLCRLVENAKARAALQWIGRRIEAGKAHCVLSNLLVQGGVMLPMDLTSFDQRIVNFGVKKFRDLWCTKDPYAYLWSGEDRDTWIRTRFPEFFIPAKTRYWP
jgi:energy-coupling factor transporter ATP-binding protein EcfA2